MPSFDVVSEVDKHALSNAVDQSNRVVGNRFDFKGVDAIFEVNEYVITVRADEEFQVQQMIEILLGDLHKNKIDVKCLEYGQMQTAGKQKKRPVTVRTGVESDVSKKMIKMIKDKKIKVQAQIQGDQVRVTGKKRDDLQAAMAVIREADLGLPLQFENFRD